MEALTDKKDYKQLAKELRERRNTVLIHSREARSKTGAVLRYPDRRYQVQADGSLRRVQ